MVGSRVHAQVRKDEKAREQVHQMSRDQLQVANECANGVRGCVWKGIIVSFPFLLLSQFHPALRLSPSPSLSILTSGYQTDRYIPENPNDSPGFIRSRSSPTFGK